MLESSSLNVDEVKKRIIMSHNCPCCGQKVKFGIEMGYLSKVQKFPFAHAVIHSDEDHGIHVLIAFIDANMQVRGIEWAESIEISREGQTFQQLLKKWSNPF